MSELSQALGGGSPPFKLVANGKTYAVSLVTNDIKIAYEKELFRKARESVAALRGDLDSVMYGEMMIKLAESFASGEFAMEGARGQKMLGTPRGSLLVLSLIMGVDEAEVMQVMLADEPQVMSVFKAVLRDSFPGVEFPENETPKATAG